MFDASEIFTGAHVNWAFDITSVGKNCPLYKEEFVEGDEVFVLHSIYRQNRRDATTLGFGVYAVILIAHKSDDK